MLTCLRATKATRINVFALTDTLGRIVKRNPTRVTLLNVSTEELASPMEHDPSKVLCLSKLNCLTNCFHGNRTINSSFPFRCECPSTYTGPICQHNLNECESSPCVHGICVDQEDGFRCFCQPGLKSSTILLRKQLNCLLQDFLATCATLNTTNATRILV